MKHRSYNAVLLAVALSLFGVSCRIAPIAATSVQTAAKPGPSSKTVDIPGDNQVITAITKGRIGAEYATDQQKIVDLVRDLFIKSNDEKPDQYGHKKNTAMLSKKIAEAIYGSRDVTKLANEFEGGMFKYMKLCTNENVDPLSNKGDKVPNYQVMNRALRTYTDPGELKEKEPQAAKLIEDFETSYSALPCVKGLVYRGTGLSTAKLKSILETKTMHDGGYTSTSVDVADALDFLSKRTTTAENTRVFMAIYGVSGKFIPFGEFSREEEVLFPHGTKFKLNHSFLMTSEEGLAMNLYYMFFEEIR